MFHSRSPLHPALAIFLIFGLVVQETESIFLIGKKILTAKINVKKAILTKKAVVMKVAMLKPIAAFAMLAKGLALAAIAKPLLIKSLIIKPIIIMPMIVGAIGLKTGIAVLTLKKGVLTAKRSVLMAKGFVIKKAFLAKKFAVAKILTAKMSIMTAKMAAVAAAGASAGAAVKKVVIGVASSAKSIGVGALNTGRSLIDAGSSLFEVGTSGVSSLANAAANSIIYLHNLKRPRVTVETHHYAVPVPYYAGHSFMDASQQQSMPMPEEPMPMHEQIMPMPQQVPLQEPEMQAVPVNIPMPISYESYPAKPGKSYGEYSMPPPKTSFPMPAPEPSFSIPPPDASFSIQSPDSSFSISKPDSGFFNRPSGSSKSTGTSYTMSVQPMGPVESIPIMPQPAETMEPSTISDDFLFRSAPEGDSKSHSESVSFPDSEFSPDVQYEDQPLPEEYFESNIPKDVEQVMIDSPALTDIINVNGLEHPDNMAPEGLKHPDQEL